MFDRTPAEALQEIIVVDDGSWPPLSIEPLGLAKEVHVMTTNDNRCDILLVMTHQLEKARYDSHILHFTSFYIIVLHTSEFCWRMSTCGKRGSASELSPDVACVCSGMMMGLVA